MNLLMQYGPLVCTVAGTIGAAIFTPAFISAHPMAFAWVNAAAQMLHAALPSIFNSGSNGANGSEMKGVEAKSFQAKGGQA
ncbi:MAG: hypothetical protein WBS24_14390 [Terriglobales bacterium]